MANRTDFTAAREQMIRQQLITNNISDERVLWAVAAVPRESFVPAGYTNTAYVDADIPLGGGRVVIEPMTMAKLIQLAAIKGDSNVLDIGCGSGYSAAVISNIAGSVAAVESDEALGGLAGNNLAKQKNVKVVIGPLNAGYAGAAPYDVITICGGAQFVPAEVEGQLKEGGRIVLVHVDGDSPVGRIRLGIKVHGVVSYRDYHDTARRLLPGFEKTVEFEL